MRRRRSKRRAGSGQGRKKVSHRLAPLPDCFHTGTGGTCRWCCKPILRPDGTVNERRRWHKENCLHEYFLVTRQSYAKREVKKRDKGICAKCGKYCHYRNEWQLDHVRPLIEAKGDISFWQLGNLQTMCNACHTAKTVAENIARAAAKAAAKQQKKDEN